MKNNDIKADYSLHDQAYRNRRSNGNAGWDIKEVTEQSIGEMEALLEQISLPQQARVLDLGCGAGNLSFWLEQRGYRVFGVDVSLMAIEWAKEEAALRGSSVCFAVADATSSLPCPDGSFDLVMDNHCFHCIIGVDREKYLYHTHMALKPGGYYILSTMCGDKDCLPALDGFDPDSRCLVVNGIALRYIGEAEGIMQEIRKAGFSLIKSEVRRGEAETADLFVVAQRIKHDQLQNSLP